MLYYDFSTGLEVAKPSSNSSSLTVSSTTNKAVREGAGCMAHVGGWLFTWRASGAPDSWFWEQV